MIAADKVLLVIPAYRESERLPGFLLDLVLELSSVEWASEIRIVDDGSGAAEIAQLEALLAKLQLGGRLERVSLRSLPANRGKGAAVRLGWADAGTATVVGFVDADGSISAQEIRRATGWLLQQGARATVFASRVKMLGRCVHRSAVRHYVGRVFATLASEGLRVPCYDSQCGFKLIPRAHYEQIAAELSEDGFCLDLEILMELHRRGLPVIEFPIDWYDKPGSRVHVFRDGWRMLQAIRRLRRRQGRVAGSVAWRGEDFPLGSFQNSPPPARR